MKTIPKARNTWLIIVVCVLFALIGLCSKSAIACHFVYAYMPVPGTYQYGVNITLTFKGCGVMNFTQGDYDKYKYDSETYELISVKTVYGVGVKSKHTGVFLQPNSCKGTIYEATAIETGRASFSASGVDDFTDENAYDGFLVLWFLP